MDYIQGQGFRRKKLKPVSTAVNDVIVEEQQQSTPLVVATSSQIDSKTSNEYLADIKHFIETGKPYSQSQ